MGGFGGSAKSGGVAENVGSGAGKEAGEEGRRELGEDSKGEFETRRSFFFLSSLSKASLNGRYGYLTGAFFFAFCCPVG